MGEEPPPRRPRRYLDGLGDHEPPIPPELMQRVFRDYERRKDERGYVDFEDLLELAIGLFEGDADALGVVRARYRAFTVDEYQDVNLLQQTLLELWLGERDDLCVVGDDYQSIYAFTGATPRHLLELPDALPARDRGPARGELPLDAAGARAREPARPEARRRGEDAAGDACGRGPSPSPRPFASLADELDVRRRADPRAARGGRPVRGDGGPLPD